jgi:3-ketosteroid 9alpha-monooxygenase subunit B
LPDAPRRKVRTFEVMVSKVIQETPDTVTLVFFTGNERLEYKAGQFLTIDPHQFPALARFTAFLEDHKKRKEPPRAYSVASAPHEPFIAITVKEEVYLSGATLYPPLLSPLLVRQTPPGTHIKVTGFTGAYVLPEAVEEQTDHIVHVVAGSGAVPNFAILKESLRTGHALRHTFLYSNKRWEDVCFRDELHLLERNYPERLKVVHTLTRQTDPAYFGERVRKGRLSLELIREAVGDTRAPLYFVCGPAITAWERRAALQAGTQAQPRFLETALEHLHQLDVDPKRVKRESWG